MLSNKNVFSMGRNTLDKAQKAREIKQAKWVKKNMPDSLTPEQIEVLKECSK